MSTVKKDSTDVTRYIMLRDSADGTPETAYTITNLDLQYTRERSTPAVKVDATALAATNSVHGDNTAIEIDGTSSPGLYRVDWPDAAFATGVDKVVLVVSGVGLDPAVEEIELVDYDPEDGVRLGLTALPNVAPDAAGGLPTTTKITDARLATLTDWIDGGRLDLLLDAIPTTAMRGTDNAALAATALTNVTWTDARAGYLDAINGHTPQTGDSYAIVNHANYGNAKLVRSTVPANTLDVTDGGCGGIDWGNVENQNGTVTLTFTTVYQVGTVTDSIGSLGTQAKIDVRTAMEADGSKLDHLWEMTEDDVGVRRLTTNALEQAPTGGGGGDATAANQTTIITHMTDVKGTGFVKDTDSLVDLAHIGADSDTLETLSDQIDGLSALSGEGAYTGTLTIDDGAGNGLEGAVVNARRGGVLKASGTTDVSGEITDWVFGVYTYDLAVRLAGYQPETDTIAVSADAWTKTISLTAISITAPSAANLTTVQFRVKLSGAAVSGAVCKARLLGINQASDGTILSNEESSDTTDSEGIAELELVQKGGIVKGSGLYKIWVEIDGKPVASVERQIPNQSTILFEDLLL